MGEKLEKEIAEKQKSLDVARTEETWREKEAVQDAERETQKRLGGRSSGGIVWATSVLPFDFRYFVIALTGQPFPAKCALHENLKSRARTMYRSLVQMACTFLKLCKTPDL